MSRTGDAACLDITIIGPDGGKNCAAGMKNALGECGVSVQRSAVIYQQKQQLIESSRNDLLD
jgi:hypothetical protein